MKTSVRYCSFFSGENHEGKAMENGQLPGELVLAVTHGYLC